MLADISMFNALMHHAPVFNSAAAVLLQTYDQNKRSVALCDRFIDEMQSEEYIPADLISEMYLMKERFGNKLIELKQEVIDQASKEPLDTFDREIFVSLSKESQDDLQSVLAADEVYQRALEMKSEAEASNIPEDDGEAGLADDREEKHPVVKKVKKPIDKQERSPEEEDLGRLDDFGDDVASTEA